MSNYTQTASRTQRRKPDRIQGLLQLQKALPVKQAIPKPWEQSQQQSASAKNTDKKEEEKKERKWFQKGAFEDGYQPGDLTKTVWGSKADIRQNFAESVVGIGETVVDTLAYLAPYAAAAQFNMNGGYYNVDNANAFQQQNDWAKVIAGDFIKKDLYDEERITKAIYTDPLKAFMGIDVETDSVFGEKSDALVQAGGQLAAQYGLKMAGVPWFITAGATSFGSEVESALRQGATFEEAGLSASITAGTEVLTEKISGGIKFGKMGTLDEIASKFLARKISNKFLRFSAQLGLDAFGEGAEGWVSEGISDFGRWLTYQDDKTLEEIYLSEDALNRAMENFWIESLLGSAGSVTKAVTQGVPNTPADTPLTDSQILQNFLETADINKLPPKTQSALRAYATKTQHLNTMQHLLDTQTQQKADTRPLEQKILQQQERIWQAEKDPVLQKIIEQERIQTQNTPIQEFEDSRKNVLDISQKYGRIDNVQGENTEGSYRKKVQILKENKKNGASFVKKVFPSYVAMWEGVQQEITILTSAGKTRVDAIGRVKNENGVYEIRIAEFKSSKTAPLTNNQKKAFRAIVESGGIVVGKGKKGFQGGTIIPPGTVIEIVRGTEGGNGYVSYRYE